MPKLKRPSDGDNRGAAALALGAAIAAAGALAWMAPAPARNALAGAAALGALYLASLSSMYRVASFIVLGLLLLGGAFAWQRVRPRALPDLRAMPEGLR